MKKIVAIILLVIFLTGCSFSPPGISSSNWKFAKECFEMADKHMADGTHLTDYEREKENKLKEMINDPINNGLSEEEYNMFLEVYKLLEVQETNAFIQTDMYKRKFDRLKKEFVEKYKL